MTVGKKKYFVFPQMVATFEMTLITIILEIKQSIFHSWVSDKDQVFLSTNKECLCLYILTLEIIQIIYFFSYTKHNYFFFNFHIVTFDMLNLAF